MQGTEEKRTARRIPSLDMTAAVASALGVDSTAEQGGGGGRGPLLSDDSRRAAIASGEHLISVGSVGQTLMQVNPRHGILVGREVVWQWCMEAASAPLPTSRRLIMGPHLGQVHVQIYHIESEV